jgi:hypothetical protein
VVGVEGMPRAKGPGGEGDSEPETEAGELEVVRNDGEDEDAPTAHIESEYHGAYTAKPSSFPAGQPGAARFCDYRRG